MYLQTTYYYYTDHQHDTNHRNIVTVTTATTKPNTLLLTVLQMRKRNSDNARYANRYTVLSARWFVRWQLEISVSVIVIIDCYTDVRH